MKKNKYLPKVGFENIGGKGGYLEYLTSNAQK